MSLALGPARRWPEWATLGLGLSAAAAVAAVALSPALDPEVQARAALEERSGAAVEQLRLAWRGDGSGPGEPLVRLPVGGELPEVQFAGDLRLGADSVVGVLLEEARRFGRREPDQALAALDEARALVKFDAERAAVLATELWLGAERELKRAEALQRLGPWRGAHGLSAAALAAARLGLRADSGAEREQIGLELAAALERAGAPVGTGAVDMGGIGEGLDWRAPAGEDRLQLALDELGSPELELWRRRDLWRRGRAGLGDAAAPGTGYRTGRGGALLVGVSREGDARLVRAWELEDGLAALGREALQPLGYRLAAEAGAGGVGPLVLPGLSLPAHVLPLDPDAIASRAIAGLAARRRGLFALVAALAGLTGAAFVALRRTRHVAQLRAELVANVSHELRTPIASILLLAENLESGRAAERPGSASYPSRILREADRLRGLVENLLDTSRLERGKALELQLEAGPLEPLFDKLVEEIGGRVRGAGLEFESSCPGEALPEVRHDAEALRRVVLNLAQNALAHASARRIELRVGPHSAREVALEVADDGDGLSAAERRRVLQPFERGSRSKASGTGLGLAICAEIARQHGGRLELVAGAGERGLVARLVLPTEPLEQPLDADDDQERIA